MMWIYFLCLFHFSIGSTHLEELKIPQKLFDSIKKTYNLDSSDVEPEMLDVTFELKLTQGEAKLNIGYTQKLLDLAQYLKKADKSFQWKLSTPYESSKSTTNVYFISRYKPFKSPLGNEYGYPCGSIFTFTNNSQRILNTDFITLESYSRQHMSQIGGDYLILHREQKKVKISFFQLRDTRWTKEMCRLDY